MREISEIRRYQQSVATFFYENDTAMAILRPGAGKTISTLTAIVDLLRDGHIRHALVIAPKRVARVTWPDEIAAWAHTKGLRYAVLSGAPAMRLKQLQTAHNRDLTIVGIDIVQWLVDELSKLPAGHCLFDLIAIDEISKLRRPGGKRTKALRRIGPRFKMKWGMTGTPRPKSLLNLFAQYRFLTSGAIWGNNFELFKKKHFYPEDYEARNWVPKPGSEAIIMGDTAPYTITLRDGDMPELPPLNIVSDFVELPPAAAREYKRMERRLFAEVEDAGSAPRAILAATRGVASGKLAQIANGFLYGEGGNADVTQLHNEKGEWLVDLVDELDGAPLLIVYEFVEDLRTLREILGPDLAYLGDGVSDKAAAQTIARWNRRELPYLALHPASGGHGLNIQFGGGDMAWYSPCWDAELWDQTIARLYRPGQAQNVTVHVCLARGTVDEMKLARVHERLTEQAAFERYLRQAGKVA